MFKSPVFHLLIGALIGILFASSFRFAFLPESLILLFFGLAILLGFYQKIIRFIQPSLVYFFISVVSALTFFCFYQANNEIGDLREIQTTQKSKLYAILETVKQKKAFQQTVAKVYRLNGQEIPFKVQFYISNNTSNVEIAEPGDTIFFRADLKEFKTNENPFVFNYKDYLNNKKVYAYQFLKSSDFILIANNEVVYNTVNIIRSYIRDVMEKNLSEEAFSLSVALLLGEKEFLQQELRESFINLGVVHVLAVSGLHVGIVVWIFSMLFVLLPKFKHKIWVETIIVLAFLWLYVLLTHSAPSVVRAATMFSFFQIGKGFNRKYSSLNAVFLSALLVLTFNPNQLFNIGFQLSYSAVLGILFFYKPIQKIKYFKFKSLDYLWKLSVVGIAAQIGTLPFTLFYFNQFPNWFWLANPIVIMLVTLILSFSIVMLIPFSPMVSVFSWLTNKVYSLLTNFVDALNYLPFKITDNIYFPLLYAMIMGGLVLLFYVLIVHRKRKMLNQFLVFLTLFFCLDLSLKALERSNQELWCFEHKDAILMVSKKGGEMHVYGDVNKDVALLSNFKREKRIVKTTFWREDIKNKKIDINGVTYCCLSSLKEIKALNKNQTLILTGKIAYDFKFQEALKIKGMNFIVLDKNRPIKL